MAGWIKLYRQFTEWEWYKDNNTKAVMLHLLLIANIKNTKYMGMVVPRGSLITKIYSIKDPENTLCGQLDLTHKEIRTALKKLSTTGEITVKTTNKFSLINIVNYSVYQENETEEGQTKGIQGADQGHTKGTHRIRSKEIKNEKNIKDIPPLPPLGGTDTKAELLAVWSKYSFEPDLHNAVKGWIKYKAEKNQRYKPQGLNSLLSQIQKNAGQYGIPTVIDLINESMANNWQGIIWDRLKNAPAKGNTQFKTSYERTLETARNSIEKYKNGEFDRIDI